MDRFVDSLQIVGLLSEYVGPHMGRSAVAAQCSKLGLDIDRLEVADLDRLAARLAVGLRLFVGAAKADEVGERLRGLVATPPSGAVPAGP